MSINQGGVPVNWLQVGGNGVGDALVDGAVDLGAVFPVHLVPIIVLRVVRRRDHDTTPSLQLLEGVWLWVPKEKKKRKKEVLFRSGERRSREVTDHHGRVNKPLEEVDSDAVGQEHPSCQPGKHFRVVAVVMAHHHAP